MVAVVVGPAAAVGRGSLDTALSAAHFRWVVRAQAAEQPGQVATAQWVSQLVRMGVAKALVATQQVLVEAMAASVGQLVEMAAITLVSAQVGKVVVAVAWGVAAVVATLGPARRRSMSIASVAVAVLTMAMCSTV